MKIKINLELNIIPQNEPLITVVSENNGYSNWVNMKIQKARTEAEEKAKEINLSDISEDQSNQTTAEEQYIVPDTTMDTFIKEFFLTDFVERIKNIISPSIFGSQDSYFGKKDLTIANAVKEQLNNAVTGEVIIER